MPNVSIQSLYAKTGCDPKNIRRWFIEAGLEPAEVKGKSKLFDEKKGLKIISQHKKGSREESDSEVDPETGLTWFKAKLMEDTLTKRRERKLQEAIDAKDYILTTLHHDVLRAVINRLEQIPGKAKSELGLTDAQTVGIRRMIDEARQESAKEIKEL